MNFYSPDAKELMQRLKKGCAVEVGELLECMYDLMEDQKDLLDMYEELRKRHNSILNMFPAIVVAFVLFVLLASYVLGNVS